MLLLCKKWLFCYHLMLPLAWCTRCGRSGRSSSLISSTPTPVGCGLNSSSTTIKSSSLTDSGLYVQHVAQKKNTYCTEWSNIENWGKWGDDVTVTWCWCAGHERASQLWHQRGASVELACRPPPLLVTQVSALRLGHAPLSTQYDRQLSINIYRQILLCIFDKYGLLGCRVSIHVGWSCRQCHQAVVR